MGFIKNRIKKYIDNIIGEVIDKKYNNEDFCQHDWELIMNTEIYSDSSYHKYPINCIKVYRCKKCGKEMKYRAQ